ncbi:MAG: hypothetical protein HYZ75_01170 [Elusimicrobia bacterium]|nr:hypothetical protein [Elusimicrobiota bacterium]
MKDKAKASPKPEPIGYELFENGLDFILSGLEHLGSNPLAKRDYKFGILHLAAGIELILKERLRREHWSLLFENVDKANTAAMTSGDFKSVTFESLVDRLAGVAQVTIAKHEFQVIDDLRKRRNKVQHLHFTETPEVIESLAAKAVGFAIDFIKDELSPKDMTSAEGSAFNTIKDKLKDFEAFVTKRLDHLKPILAKAKKDGATIVECIRCFQEALVVDGEELKCRFCSSTFEPLELADDWASQRLGLVLLLAAPVGAQDRPDEGSMFGAAPEVKEPPQPDAFTRGDAVDNPLSIGGRYWQRWQMSKPEGQATSRSPVSAPLQFDAFMDARPSDRVRGFVQGRLFYDPTRDRSGGGAVGSTSGAPLSLSSSVSPSQSNPNVALDQAWLKFDIERKVFVTAGKQHVKWGVSRFWNPTDFLNPARRDPLVGSDQRLGNTMVKFSVPLEDKEANLTALILLDNPRPAGTLGQTGAAFRAEKVFHGAELGAEAVARGNLTPSYGADVSMPLGPFDVYAEAAVQTQAPGPRFRRTGTPTTGANIATLFAVDNPKGPFYQASGGGTYTFAWQANRTATAGVEYFYNELGYDGADIYPLLIFLGSYQPFYTGRHYGAFYVTAEGPDAGKHTTYTFSTLSNLSDGSFISRIDFAWRFLTYLTFEAFADQHFGTRGGEFRFALNTPALTYNGAAVAPINLPATVYDLGVGLRLSF